MQRLLLSKWIVYFKMWILFFTKMLWIVTVCILKYFLIEITIDLKIEDLEQLSRTWCVISFRHFYWTSNIMAKYKNSNILLYEYNSSKFNKIVEKNCKISISKVTKKKFFGDLWNFHNHDFSSSSVQLCSSLFQFHYT